MFKAHKKALIISSVVILLPIVFGLLFWEQLPDVMTTHWGMDNQPDGWSGKSFAVFGTPLLLLGLHWLCLWITNLDKRQKNQSKKAIAMIFWIMPMISLFSSAITYSIALGHTVSITSILLIMMGLMFMCVGNYLPKTKQNYTLGIKICWTLSSEENWNATHRFAGKVWFIGGLLIMLGCFLPVSYGLAVMLPAVLLLAFTPILYSYLYYRKMCKEGRGYSLKATQTDKKISRISIICGILILIFLAFLMLSGDIQCVFHDTSFTIEADYYDDLTVAYDTIDSIELRKEPIPGSRAWGYGSARLLLGIFENEEFGQHTRYTYTNCQCAIVIHADGKVLVLAKKTPEETTAIYDTLLKKTGLEG